MSSTKPWEESSRLASAVIPLHYDLYLHPDLETDEFSGEVTIRLRVEDEQSHLWLHIKELNISHVEISVQGQTVQPKSSFEYRPHEFFVVELPELISANSECLLTLSFEGRLDSSIVGFYRSIYKSPINKDNNDEKSREIHKMATSKFQPTYARRAFPCFDEPCFKSTFAISLVKPSDNAYVALSNMPEKQRYADSPTKGLTTVEFDVSVPMVTYLAVFIVSDLVHVERTEEIPYRVFGTKYQREKLQFSLDLAIRVVEFYTNYFDLKYPLPKLDMAAIPDYSSGATEHWGLITYRETSLLLDPDTCSARNELRVASVVAHELAHQWFGNLMTVRWWDDLWLNEGFATFISYLGLKDKYEGLDVEAMFVEETWSTALEADASRNTRPIVRDVCTPDQITAVFDVIAYCKGSSVIRMMRNFMGDKLFRRGLKAFLEEFSYKSAITSDLFHHLNVAIKENNNKNDIKVIDVALIMDTWIRQKGFPLIKVENLESNKIILTQKLFVNDKNAEKEEHEYKWEVPISFSTDSNKKGMKWFHAEDDSLQIELPQGTKWVKLNCDHFGYYRVHYSDSQWSNFASVLLDDPNKLSTADRAGLLSDAFAIAQADFMPLKKALDLTKYLHKEQSYQPWRIATEQLSRLYPLCSDEITAALKKYLGEKALRAAEDVFGEDWLEIKNLREFSLTQRLLRALLFGLGCQSEDAECLNKATRDFRRWIEDETQQLDPDLQEHILKYGLHGLSSEEEESRCWHRLCDRYGSECDAQIKQRLSIGMASTKSENQLNDLLKKAVKNEELVRGQDFFQVLIAISRGSKVGESVVWDFWKTNWSSMVDRFSLNDRIMGRSVAIVTSRFNSSEKLSEMKGHFEEFPEAGAGENYRKIALESVQRNLDEAQRLNEALNNWIFLEKI